MAINRRVYFGWHHLPSTRTAASTFKDSSGLAYRIEDNERSDNFRDGIVAEPGKDKDVGDFKVPHN